MACCAAAALLIGAVREFWFRLVPSRRPARAGFAPPARRAAPAGGHPGSPSAPSGPRAVPAGPPAHAVTS
jgi:hypothetical protein